MNKYFTTLLPYLFSWCCQAQTAHFQFQHLGIKEGMYQSGTYDIYQDRNDFLWFTSASGLHRYDGLKVDLARMNDSSLHQVTGSEVKAFFEDSQGRLWIKTLGALTYYDPYQENFIRFLPDSSDSTALSGSSFCRYCILEDEEGNIWIGTREAGVNMYQLSTSNFFRIHLGRNLNSWSQHISAMVKDGQGNIWIGTSGGGLYKWVNTLAIEHFQHEAGNPSSLFSNTVQVMILSRKGTLWIATDKGVNRLDPRSGETSRIAFPFNVTDKYTGDFSVDLREDSRGRIWGTASEIGVFNYDPETGSSQFFSMENSGLSENHIWAITEDLSGRIWLGTDSKGIDVYDPENGGWLNLQHDPTEPSSLSGDNIRSLYRDKTGIIWVGTWDGINYYDPNLNSFRHISTDPDYQIPLSSTQIVDILEDRKGTIWLGTFGEGLVSYDPKTGQFISYKKGAGNSSSLSSNRVFGLAEGLNGWIWMNTRNGGLNGLNPTTGRIVQVQIDPETNTFFPNTGAEAVLPNRYGRIWSGKNGLKLFGSMQAYLANKPAASYNYISGLSETLHVLGEDCEGNVWSLNSNKELSKFNPNKKEREIFQMDPKIIPWLKWGTPFPFMDSKCNLWVSLWNHGLVRLSLSRLSSSDLEVATYNSSNSNLPHDLIWDFSEDPGGQIWLAMENGVAVYDEIRDDFTAYGIKEGLRTVPQSIVAGRDGHIYIGGRNGFGFFKPDQQNSNSHLPKVFLKAIQINNQPLAIKGSIGDTLQFTSPLAHSITFTDRLELEYWQNDIRLDFVALNFTQPKLNQYKYRLLPYNKDWISSSAEQPSANYTNLSPGLYRFELIASNNDGVWNYEGASLAITIHPPWWATWWAYLLYILLGLTAILVLFQWRTRIHRRKLAEQQRINAATSKFVPQAFLQSIGRKDIMEVQLGDQIEREVTVLFLDIRDYTSISEKMTPEENFKFINNFHQQMGPIIQAYHGYINQYLGDGVMALFDRSPEDALQAAVAMQVSLRDYNAELKDKTRRPLRIGIGLHTGPLIMGIIGDHKRLDAAIISDTVNTASRIENLTKHYLANILLSWESMAGMITAENLSQPGDTSTGESTDTVDLNLVDDGNLADERNSSAKGVRYLGQVQLKGKKEPIAIYECFAGDAPKMIAAKQQTKAQFEEGLRQFLAGKFTEAQVLFKGVLKVNPEDAVAHYFYRRSAQYALEGVPEDWTGVEMMAKK